MKSNLKVTIISVLSIATVVVAVFFFWSGRATEDEAAKSEEKKSREKAIVELDPERMSRITFFNTSNDRVSLAIPEWWEGRYRMVENGDQISFDYISDTGGSMRLFTVRKYPNNTWQEDDPDRIKGESKMMTRQDTTYSYYLSTEDQNGGKPNDEYLEMQNQVALIIGTIK